MKDDLFTNFDNIARCLQCNLISALKLTYKDGKPMINYYCENNHKGDITLEEYIQKYNINSLLKQNCNECKKNKKEIKGDFYYCHKCIKFICHSCLLNHPIDEKHYTVNIKRYDSSCKIHYNYYSFYCIKCTKNLCIYCKSEHKTHELLDLSEIVYELNLDEKIKNIEKNIKD